MKFKHYRIADLLDEISMGPFGSNIKKECFVSSGVPVLNGSNLTDVAMNDDVFRYVTEEKADSLGRANAHRGDVVVTHRGTLGQISFIPDTSLYDRYVISQSQFRFRCNDKVLPEYLTYYFHTRKGQYDLLSNSSQVGVPALARATTTFQQLEVDIPGLDEQRKIIGLLENIRKKTELNKKINENLYAMEDFCQLSRRLTQDKYKGSYENCGRIVKRYSSMPGLDLTEMYLRVAASFVIGNSDMHLKNFSLIENMPGNRTFQLSKAYDMLPVNVIMPEDKEQMALTINGKKRNIHKKEFRKLAESYEISPKAAENMLKKISRMENKLLDQVEEAYLSKEQKEQVSQLIHERIKTLSS